MSFKHQGPGLALAIAASITVSYADLDVGTSPGASELVSRIDAAARKVCAGQRYGIGVDRRALYDACVRDSTRDALRRADGGRVAGLFVVQVRRAAPPGSP